MSNYQKLYTTLFNAITNAVNILKQAQQDTEEMYILADQPNFTVLKKTDIDSDEDSQT